MQISTIKADSWTDATRVEVKSLQHLSELIVGGKYSGSLFKNNYSNNENFESTEVIILDIDNGEDDEKMSLNEAKLQFADYKCIIATTRSHQTPKEKGGRILAPVDKFRVILFLSEPITSGDDYYATWFKVAAQFPAVDGACKDPARRLFASREIILINETGKTIAPIKAQLKPSAHVVLAPGQRGRLGQQTQSFMRAGAPSGKWNANLYRAARDHYQNNYTEDEFITLATCITGELDRNDLTTIHSAFKRAPKHPPRPNVKHSAVEQWARQWFKDNCVQLKYQSDEMTYNGSVQPSLFITSRMVLDAKYWAETNPIIDADGKKKARPAYTADALEHVYNVWQKEQKDEIVDGYKRLVEYDPCEHSPIEQWVRAVTGTNSTFDVAVMSHFIWQVKRKLQGLDVVWHIMPILKGKTGGGKTIAVKRLMEPIREITMSAQSLKLLEDTREAYNFGKFYIIFFDEMEHAERISVNALKNKITCDSVSYRRLNTNMTCTDRNVATCIAASNRSVQDIIYDPTSARRFWQIEARDRLDRDAINAIDYTALWRSVDEFAESPIIPHIDQIFKVQNDTLRAKSLVEQWLEDCTEPGGEALTGFSYLYNSFQEWCQVQNIKKELTYNRFSRQLGDLGIEKVKRNNGPHYKLHVMSPEEKAKLKLVPQSN